MKFRPNVTERGITDMVKISEQHKNQRARQTNIFFGNKLLKEKLADSLKPRAETLSKKPGLFENLSFNESEGKTPTQTVLKKHNQLPKIFKILNLLVRYMVLHQEKHSLILKTVIFSLWKMKSSKATKFRTV